MRILIIDDDTELCQLVADYLTPMGFEVETAHDGDTGADLATSEAWAAISPASVGAVSQRMFVIRS